MIKKYLLLLSLAASTLLSCSNIPENERFITIDSVEPVRTVLLEEFTGQNCPNCPAAHRTVNTLLEQYGDKLIPVSIHAGNLAISCDARRPGLMQPEGNTYNDRYGIDEWPKGVIDGRSGALNHDRWSDFLRQEMTREANLEIELYAKVSDAAEPAVMIEYELKPTADLSGTLHLWILEDGIVARQSDKEQGGVVADYIHNHVYRAAANGIEGESISLRSGIHLTGSCRIAVRNTEKEQWNTASLSAVAFVRLPDGSVEQAAKFKVLLPESPQNMK